MNLFPFFLVSLSIFALLNFALLPSAKRRLRIDTSMASIGNAAYFSLLSFMRAVFMVAALTSAVLIAVIFILQMFGGTTVREATSAIERLIQWRAILTGFGQVWGWAITLSLVAVLAVYARRSGRVSREKVFQKLFDRKFEELKKKYELGELEHLESTSDMREIENECGKLITALQSLEQENQFDEKEAAAIRDELLKRLSILEQYHFALDIRRRIEAQVNPDDVALPEAKTKWEKIQTFFISQGLLATLSRSTKIIYFASLALLVPALLGIYSVSSVPALDSKIIQLKDLRVELNRQEFEQEKARLGQPENELDEADEQVLQEVARQYEQTATPFRIPTPVRSSMYAMRSNLVRQAVLTGAAKDANAAKQNYDNGAAWEQYPSGTKIGDLTDLEKQIVEMPEQAALSRAPVTRQGRQMYADLEDLAKRSPSLMEKIRGGWHSFQKPATSMDISYALFNQISSTLAGETPGQFGDIFKGFDLKNMQSASRSYSDAHAKQFLTTLTGGDELDKAFRVADASDLSPGFLGTYERAEFQNTMRTVIEKAPFQEINQKFSDHPPSIKIAPEKHLDVEKAVAELERFKSARSSQSPRNDTSNADPIIDFQDLFPGQIGVESETPHGRLITKWNGNNPNTPPFGTTIPPPPGDTGGPGISSSGPDMSSTKPGSKIPQASRTSFSRARSFSALRGFSRVGGVLIGQTPSDVAADKPSKLNFTDLRWEAADNNLRFVIVDGDGGEMRSRPFRPSIVYHALNYAVDGRMTAATMISTEPLEELKILLHPTLVDSALGYRVIELDRFVDVYTAENQKLDQARDESKAKIESQQILYKFASCIRFLVLLEGYNDREAVQIRRQVNEFVCNNEVREIAAKTLQDTASIADPLKSPLTVKKEFFDPELVELLIKTPPGSGLDVLVRSIQAKAKEQWNQVKYSNDKKKIESLWRRWGSPPPEFQVWSGVRERNFNAAFEDVFVADGNEIPMPFDFMLQVAFTTPPVFIDESASETYNDTEPWEFPSLRDEIQTTVLNGIKNNPQRAEVILKDISEFAMLQRLFRMALDGNLGDNFPVERLIELFNSITFAAPKTVHRTPRWNARSQAEIIKATEAAIMKEKDAEKRKRMTEVLKEKKAYWAQISPLRKALGVEKDEPAKREKDISLPPLE